MRRLSQFVRGYGSVGRVAAALMAPLLAVSLLIPAVANAQDYEIWALDQGTHLLHIYDAALTEVEVIDLEAHGALVPHMIDFTPDHAYAFIANLNSGNVSVIRTSDREVTQVVETGPMTHMASVSPDGRTALAAVMDANGELVELRLEPETGDVTVGRRLRIAEDPLVAGIRNQFNGTSPVCMDYSADGRYSYVSLGPALSDGGLVVLDMEAFELVAAYPPEELRVNCGTVRSPTGRHMFANGGSGDVGVWYVIDTETHEPVHTADSRGTDAHGVWATPNGDEVWMVNRVSGNVIIIDPASFEIVDEIAEVGSTPDIIAMSPDNARAFITLRGPNPITAAHVAVGETPGFSVVDIGTREHLLTIQPAEGNEASDFHGIGVRVIR
jgi:DNA-binding beta-propeller fold protein YncE